jgi:hypothetical protein
MNRHLLMAMVLLPSMFFPVAKSAAASADPIVQVPTVQAPMMIAHRDRDRRHDDLRRGNLRRPQRLNDQCRDDSPLDRRRQGDLRKDDDRFNDRRLNDPRFDDRRFGNPRSDDFRYDNARDQDDWQAEVRRRDVRLGRGQQDQLRRNRDGWRGDRRERWDCHNNIRQNQRRVWIPGHYKPGFLGIGRKWVEGYWEYR